MRMRRAASLVCIAALLVSCGGDGGTNVASATGGSGTPTPTPTPTPPTGASCSLAARQDWALSQLREWYLFPDLLDEGVDPGAYGSLQAYVDALVAPARAAGRDRNFTHVTSIKEENEYYNSGETAGFGFVVELTVAGEIVLSDVFEGSPAYQAGFRRGVRILEIGDGGGGMVSVERLLERGGYAAVLDAFGAAVPGVQREFRYERPNGANGVVTITKAEFEILPVSPDFGVEILTAEDGSRFGYVHLRTFIETARTPLTQAFQQFRSDGVDRVALDFRDNGGGLVYVASLMGDLMGRDRSGDVFSRVTYRPSKSSYNETRRFTPLVQSVALDRLAVIGTRSTASASELVANAFPPFLGQDAALVGENTYGKPVGQIALDRAECDDRLRVVAFRTANAAGNSDYYNGLADSMPVFCPQSEDIFAPLGSTDEPMIAEAGRFLAGGEAACTGIAGATAKTAQGVPAPALIPAYPSAAQREMPGFF